MTPFARPRSRFIALGFAVTAASCGGYLALTRTADAQPAPQAAQTVAATEAASQPMDPVIASIRDEGLNRSCVMETLDYLCNVIGQRLTASPSAKAANDWTKDRMAKWGLANSHLEPWSPFGTGWVLKSYALNMTDPQYVPIKGFPKAWSPGLQQPIEGSLVYMNVQTQADLDKYRGKLAGKIVLIGPVRTVTAHFDPEATRQDASRLERLAGLPLGVAMNAARGPATGTNPATTAAATGRGGAGGGANVLVTRAFSLAAQEGAALVLDASPNGDGGTIFVTSASVPAAATAPASAPTSGPAAGTRPWSVNPPKTPPQIALAIEDFNRLARMCIQNVDVKIKADLQVQFLTDNVTVYNTIAEIPGSDLKDQVVMAGAHLDSWHAGTGATDNGAGSAVVMEAARILSTLNLKPRRTIRFALWTGEEEGLLGSRAYVKEHFGYREPLPAAAATEPAAGRGRGGRGAAAAPTKIIKGPDFDKLQLYLNLDNGTGRVRGISTQSNPKAVPFFKEWIKPFADLDAKTVSLGNMASTDHVAFDDIGLPGFNFMQDAIEYGTRTHHSNEDVFDRIQPEDMKQASTIMAAFLWQAANMEEKFPRKDLPTSPATAAGQ